MLLHVRAVLTPAEVAQANAILAKAPWEDGRLTAGTQSAQAKNNLQLREDCDETRTVQQMLLRGLERHQVFFSAALPKQISPPLFNRYGGAANAFGNHVDSAVRFLRDGSGRVRTDVSCTLFLSDPADYDGGELVIEDTHGAHTVKLPAGHMIVYPADSRHQITPVSRGARIACFFWVQSLVRDGTQRRMLFDLDTAIQQLTATGADESARVRLVGCYHNLLRMWADT